MPKRRKNAGPFSVRKTKKRVASAFGSDAKTYYGKAYKKRARSLSAAKRKLRSNPTRAALKLPRAGRTRLRAKQVDVITRGGKIVEVKVKR